MKRRALPHNSIAFSSTDTFALAPSFLFALHAQPGLPGAEGEEGPSPKFRLDMPYVVASASGPFVGVFWCPLHY